MVAPPCSAATWHWMMMAILWDEVLRAELRAEFAATDDAARRSGP